VVEEDPIPPSARAPGYPPELEARSRAARAFAGGARSAG
jgi:hypothetical protein